MKMTMTMRTLSALVLVQPSFSFVFRPQRQVIWGQEQRPRTTARYNFFKDMIDQAFDNDPNLSADKRKGQYDAPGEEYDDNRRANVGLTETQKRWRQTQMSNDVTLQQVENTSWKASMFLAGVPERDPSNDLYASKINISSRDKSTGLALPSEPSVIVTVEFLENEVCRVSPSEFTSGEIDGKWKLSEDGKILRFSLDAKGYYRTVQTKGSIQKIYWSNEEQRSRLTSATYSIPPGWVYVDVPIMASKKAGTFEFGDGVLRIEKQTGMLGIASKMVPCGKVLMTPQSKD